MKRINKKAKTEMKAFQINYKIKNSLLVDDKKLNRKDFYCNQLLLYHF